MKTVGIIGGIAPGSTIEYYRQIIAAYRQALRDNSYPAIIINSIDMTKMLGLAAEDLGKLTEYLVGEVHKLAQAGADFGVLASNTPHLVFDEISRASPIPLISIVQAACDEAGRLGLKRVGLFGTRITMQSRFYPAVFARQGITIIAPEPSDQAFIHDKYMSELVNGIFLPATRERLLEIVDRMRDQQGIQGLILGGTELPLILPASPAGSVPFLDTTAIHVKRIVEEMTG